LNDQGWKSQEAIGERLEQLVKQHAYSLGHFNCSWLWRQNGTGGQQGQRGRDTTNIHPHAIRRRPTSVEKQFDRFLVAKRSAEASAQGSASNSTVEQTHCAAGMTGRKESFLSPCFLYWAPPNRRTAHRWAAKSVNPQKHFDKAIERLTPDDAFDSLHPGPLFVLSLSLSLSLSLFLMPVQPREWEAAASRGWWPCSTEAW
jgi:hypothetical protein